MRKILIILFTFLLITACQDKGQVVKPNNGPAHIMLLDTECYFGILTSNSRIEEREIAIINDGSEPLVIRDVQTSCHCTTVEYSKEPIEPGHFIMMKIKLDVSSLSTGEFVRTIDIYPEGGSPTTITVTGEKI